jgi:hypothetical protein
MIGRYVTYTVLGAMFMIGWNVFLIQRDDAMYKSYYRQQAMENIKRPPSSEIR